MTVEYRTVVDLKAQLSKFSGIVSKGFKKPKRKLIKEILYGIQALKDMKLSNISRTLKEEQSLTKTEGRLSRNLGDEGFTDAINEEIMKLGASKVTKDMVIAIDPEEIRRKGQRVFTIDGTAIIGRLMTRPSRRLCNRSCRVGTVALD
jgi:hypothetical protein